MFSFEVNGDSKIVEYGISVPEDFSVILENNRLLKISNLKVYINGKRSYKKIKMMKDGWRFVRPIKLTGKDVVTYTWAIDFKRLKGVITDVEFEGLPKWTSNFTPPTERLDN